MRACFARIGLLWRFSLLGLTLVAALGAALCVGLRAQLERRGVDHTEEVAVRVARLGIQPHLTAADVRGGLDRRQLVRLDRVVRAEMRAGGLAGVRVLSADGHVVYANDRELVGKRPSAKAGVRRALDGEPSSELLHKGEETGNRLRPGGRLLEVHVPLRFAPNRRPAGAVELHLPYARVAEAIRGDSRRLYLALAGGLALLWAALLPIVASASRRLREQALENRRRALHDPLTGLPNRRLFHDRVTQAVKDARRFGTLGAVLLMDLDRFREVNDTLGHRQGDALLRDVGARLRSLLRENDTVARLGGDEFGLLLPAVAAPSGAAEVAAKVRQRLADEFEVGQLAIQVDASIGIAVFPLQGNDADALLQRADVAMYQAKRHGSGVETYRPESDPHSPALLALVGELRRALAQDQLVLHYQPKLELRTGRVRGVEALVRWPHPEHGLLWPGSFVPMAERTGLIAPLTGAVLRRALIQCRKWMEAGHDLNVSVNLSARNLIDPKLPNDVARLLARWRVPAHRLELEITESTIMTDPERASEVLSRLHTLGVRLSIDDFGTGHSSLAYLQQLPVHELKIDRGFVAAMDGGRGDALIVRAAIELGHRLGLDVVGEGVEDEATLEALANIGCDLAQGYHLAAPMPEEELAEWLRGRGVLGDLDLEVA